jgi:hypothetical protein
VWINLSIFVKWVVRSVDNSKGFKMTIHSFLFACTDFLNNLIYFSLATWRSTIIQKKSCSYNWMRGIRPNRKGRNPVWERWDSEKTKIFVWRFDGISEGFVFMRKLFEVRSCWKFCHRCGSYPRAYPEILKFFPHMVQEIFGN